MLTQEAIRQIVGDVHRGKLKPEKAFAKLKNLPYEIFPFARIDHHRTYRKGFPEAVYAPGKTPEQLFKIVQSIRRSGQPLLVTRLQEADWRALSKKIPDLKYSCEGRIAYAGKSRKKPSAGTVAVISAGTADIPVAEEAAVTLELVGIRAKRFFDCGVAGFHRLFDVLPELKRAAMIICVAGMDGVLASAIAGLVARPLVAVPTSVGYGASFDGLAPLLTMLNACSQGVAVVNIDNGFGAACFAYAAVTSKK